jgi:hypothetical protein
MGTQMLVVALSTPFHSPRDVGWRADFSAPPAFALASLETRFDANSLRPGHPMALRVPVDHKGLFVDTNQTPLHLPSFWQRR